jgi:hypothetical protein
MLKLVTKSSNKKLGNIASTYRSGGNNVYSSCPSACPMKPAHSAGSAGVDEAYLDAVLRAVPRGGRSWTYTHFAKERIPLPGLTGGPETTINISTDSMRSALDSIQGGWPTVVVDGSDSLEKSSTLGGVRFVRCPAEYVEEVTCSNCGGDRGPLCAQANRNFVVKFTAHGASKKRVDARVNLASNEAGGCYGSGGPVHLQWKRTMQQEPVARSDGEVLLEWVTGLGPGSIVRHHVLGDLGLVS